MSCCDETTTRVPSFDLSRRSVLKGSVVVASVISALRPALSEAQSKRIKLAYCSQLLCGVPYEVARSAGMFKGHGLDVEIQAYANVHADIRRFAVTGRLPLFAVVTAPRTASQIRALKDLEGKTIAVSALGNADHALALFLLRQANADASKVKFATMGVNLLEGLRQGQVDVGLVQEPALTLLQASGARVLVNAMDLDDARRYLGGAYEFMGVAVRGKEFEQRRPEMIELTRALTEALKAM